MVHFKLDPEVAGGLGSNSIIDRSIHPPIVKELHYEFEGWLGDDIVTTFPCYLVTEKLADSLIKNEIDGFELKFAEVTKSESFGEMYPNKLLPKFSWLKVTGQPFVTDIGLDALAQLIVSDKAMAVLEEFKIDHCDIEQLKI